MKSYTCLVSFKFGVDKRYSVKADSVENAAIAAKMLAKAENLEPIAIQLDSGR